jgi:CBS domain-containing protein
MKTYGRGAVLVEEDGALVGIFTERDLLNRVDHADALWSHVVVRDVMTPHPMVIHPDESLSEALRRLTQGHRRHLPVVDPRGHVIGLISIRDILTYVAERFPEEMMNLPPHPDHES